MQKEQQQDQLAKDPKDWVSGDDPETPSQRSYIETLAEQAGTEPPNGDLTKAEASETIDRLRNEAGLE
ncbi:MAG: DUF3072 domain-containing protein [Acidobacteriota bacterium]